MSTVDYYRLINQFTNEALGDLNFATCLIHSFNYADIKRNNDRGDWDKTLNMIAKASENMKRSGAEAIVLCANTMHLIAGPLEERIGLPVIHIATATARAIKSKQIRKVGLLGTRFTMEHDFFTDKLKEEGIEAIIPPDAERGYVHETIFEEFGRGLFLPETKARYQAIMSDLQNRGAEGIILGCTEIPMLLNQTDFPAPLFDTTYIHARAAVDFALQKD